jgi:hypothetical protein
MSDELQKIAWASTEAGASAGQAREPVLWEDGLLMRVMDHLGSTAFDFPSLALLAQTTSAALIGVDNSGFTTLTGDDIQEVLGEIDTALGSVTDGVILANGTTDFTGDQSLGGYGLAAIKSAAFADGATSFTVAQAAGVWSLTSSVDLRLTGTEINFEDSDYVTGDLIFDKTGSSAWKISSNSTVNLTLATSSLILHDDNYTTGDLIFDKTAADVWDISSTTTAELDLGFAIVKTTGDIYSSSSGWVDWSASVTITGITSITSKIFNYRRIGKMVYVRFCLVGTNTATYPDMTLPFAAFGINNAYLGWSFNSSGVSGNHVGPIQVDNTGAKVYLLKDAAATWPSSDSCGLNGTFWYLAD